MEELAYLVKSNGICQLCGHNIYDDKTHPPWMACYCEKPEILVDEPVAPSSPPREDYC